MKTIHLISHTHWDREWYRTFQQFRLQLVHLVDGLLDILATDRDYKHFMLDGQTIVLDDYLLMRPQAESTLKRHIQNGRLLIGPWHILPDMFLVSPEAHIRNLLAGDREARRFGPKMMIGYMPDSFGHIGQMPQILKGFSIDNACLWRGLDDQPTEFWWQAPDGSRVLMLYLRDSYSNGAGLNASNPIQFTEQINRAADSLTPHSAVSDLLIMYGTDHMEPSPDTSKAVKSANKDLKEYRLIHSTLPDYFASVQAQLKKQKAELPVVSGELRSPKRSHMLPGVLSTRMWIKQHNRACENLLEKWAEPFSTFADQISDTQPSTITHKSEIVRQAWLMLIQNHPHDSICGCSIDQVHDEMRPRFDQTEQIGEEITKQSLESLASTVNTEDLEFACKKPLSSIVVFNPRSFSRTDVVTAALSLPSGVSDFEIVDGEGNIVPHQSATGQTTDFMNIRVKREELGGLLGMVSEGRAGNLTIQKIYFQRDGATLKIEAIFTENGTPRIDIWNKALKELQNYLGDTSIETFHIHARSPESADITLSARNIPALGWKAFSVRGKERAPTELHVTPVMRLLAPLAKFPAAQSLLAKLSQPKVKPPYIIENDFLSVEFKTNDGTLTVTDKKTGKVYRAMNQFVDGGDCGDEYNFCPPQTDVKLDTVKIREIAIMRGPVQQKMSISLTMTVPATLSTDRQTRAAETVELPITTTVILTHGIPRADIHTSVENRAKDHRLRVHFSVPFKVQAANHDGHFAIVKRQVGIPSFDESWVEEPRPETHQHAFTSITDHNNTLTIANRGLPEVEVTNSEIVLTLLRSVGWLSRDDFSNRKNHAGPFLETPSAQMLGEWEFDYSIIAGRDNLSSYQQAWNFESPLRAVGTGIHAGILPSSGSFVSADNPSYIVSAVKEAENGKGWIVRGYNLDDEDITVKITPWRKFSQANKVNMAEEMVSRLQVERSGTVIVTARGHEVVTVRFSD